MNEGRRTRLEAQIESQSRLIAALAERLERLERHLAPSGRELTGSSKAVRVEDPVPDRSDPDTASQGRRRFLKLAGTTAAGTAVAIVARPQMAAALDGGAYSGAETSFTYTGPSDITKAAVRATAQNPNSNGVIGNASGPNSAGIAGTSSNGYGVYGSSSTGYGVFCAGRAGFNSVGNPDDLRPPVGTYTSGDAFNPGDVLRLGSQNSSTPTPSDQGSMWVCVGGGYPGVWRKIAGSTTAGSFHPTDPVRVYESRLANGGTGGPLAGSTERTITIALSITGSIAATAVTVNLTVVSGGGSGFMTLYPGGTGLPTASVLNWSAAGQIIANGTTVKLGPGNTLKVFASAGPTDFFIDLLGYYA